MTLSTSGKLAPRSAKDPIVVTQRHEVVLDQPQSRSLTDEVYQIRDLTEAPSGKVFRRFLWVWLRIYVNNPKEKVNIRIPLPIPFLGALLPRQLYLDRALILRELMQHSTNPAQTMKEYLDSTMAVEFVRVEDGNELVIIGLD